MSDATCFISSRFNNIKEQETLAEKLQYEHVTSENTTLTEYKANATVVIRNFSAFARER
jgi:hypothetical protein